MQCFQKRKFGPFLHLFHLSLLGNRTEWRCLLIISNTERSDVLQTNWLGEALQSWFVGGGVVLFYFSGFFCRHPRLTHLQKEIRDNQTEKNRHLYSHCVAACKQPQYPIFSQSLGRTGETELLFMKLNKNTVCPKKGTSYLLFTVMGEVLVFLLSSASNLYFLPPDPHCLIQKTQPFLTENLFCGQKLQLLQCFSRPCLQGTSLWFQPQQSNASTFSTYI